MVDLAIEDIVHRKRISMEARKVEINPILPGEDSRGIEHYRCHLRRPGKEMEAYLSVETSEGRPNLYDVLTMLAMDASGCEMLRGYDLNRERWVAIFDGPEAGSGEIEQFWDEYRGRCKQIEEFKSFLGVGDYKELLASFRI